MERKLKITNHEIVVDFNGRQVTTKIQKFAPFKKVSKPYLSKFLYEKLYKSYSGR